MPALAWLPNLGFAAGTAAQTKFPGDTDWTQQGVGDTDWAQSGVGSVSVTQTGPGDTEWSRREE